MGVTWKLILTEAKDLHRPGSRWKRKPCTYLRTFPGSEEWEQTSTEGLWVCRSQNPYTKVADGDIPLSQNTDGSMLVKWDAYTKLKSVPVTSKMHTHFRWLLFLSKVLLDRRIWSWCLVRFPLSIQSADDKSESDNPVPSERVSVSFGRPLLMSRWYAFLVGGIYARPLNIQCTASCDERLHNVSFSRHSKHKIWSATPPETATKPPISKHLRHLQYHRVFLHQRPSNYMIRISPESVKPHTSSLFCLCSLISGLSGPAIMQTIIWLEYLSARWRFPTVIRIAHVSAWEIWNSRSVLPNFSPLRATQFIRLPRGPHLCIHVLKSGEDWINQNYVIY